LRDLLFCPRSGEKFFYIFGHAPIMTKVVIKSRR
jgi:hypothetical protein